jgi:hypothetical protein
VSVDNAQFINQTSGEVEYYTPPAIIEAAREVMGSIDLDPFSSIEANKRVGAARIFTMAEDGFAQDWNCQTLWMNHPFGRKYNKRAVDKLEAEWLARICHAACCITYACTSEKWFQPLLRRPQCFLSPRTDYYLPDGSKKRGVTKGSVVTYFGLDASRFKEVFSTLGVVKL